MLLVSKFAKFTLLLAAISPVFAQYGGWQGGGGFGGPSILGRGGTGVGRAGTEPHPIRVGLSLNGSYDSSMLGYAVNSEGKLDPVGVYGASVGFSASGTKFWKKTYFAVDYLGDYSRNFPNTYYSGWNHQLNAVVGQQLNQKWEIVSQTGAGTSNRYIGGQALFQEQQLEFITAPTQELFNSRSYFVGNNTSVLYTLDQRRSIRGSGYVSSVKRVATSLVDMQSYGGAGDYVHRLNRNTSVGVSYTFGHYDYKQVFGESDVQMLGVHISHRIGRAWSVGGSVSGIHQHTIGVRTFLLDPIIAAILGRPSGTETFDNKDFLMGFSAGVNRSLRRSSFGVSAQRSVVPGNGYLVTSLNESIYASFNHNFTRTIFVNAYSGYNRMTSLGFTSNRFSGWNTGVSTSRSLTDTIGVTAGYEWRHYGLQQSNYNRGGYRVSVGLTYHPQGGPAGLF